MTGPDGSRLRPGTSPATAPSSEGKPPGDMSAECGAAPPSGWEIGRRTFRRRLVESQFELVDELLARLVPVLGVLRHGPRHHGVDRCGQFGADPGHRWWRLDQVGPQQGGVIVPAERRLPCQALMEHAAHA